MILGNRFVIVPLLDLDLSANFGPHQLEQQVDVRQLIGAHMEQAVDIPGGMQRAARTQDFELLDVGVRRCASQLPVINTQSLNILSSPSATDKFSFSSRMLQLHPPVSPREATPTPTA